MPIYEYRCGACESVVEAIQKFSDPPLVICPECGAHRLEKQLSQSSFSLKGGGWYADGYGPSKKGESSKSSSSPSSNESTPKSTSASDSKTSTKTSSSTSTSNSNS